MVIGAAVLLFIASFLEFWAPDCGGQAGCPDGESAWKSEFFPALPSIFLAGIIAAGLIVGARFLPPGRNFLGLSLDQWGTALAVFALWTSLWTIIGGDPYGIKLEAGAGQILGLIASLVLAGTALASTRVPALKAPLMAAGGGPSPYGAPGGPQPGYGYPGPQPGGAPYGAQPPGQPFGGQPGGAPGPAAPQPGAPAAGGDFSPFWFAVPVARPLYAEDGSSQTIAELAPGTWYLAVEQRGQALVAQTQDGRRGVLQDTTGIQRG